MKYNKRRGFFCKMVKMRRDSLLNRGKGRGVMGKMPCLLPPHALGNRGGGRGSAAAPIPAAKDSGVASE